MVKEQTNAVRVGPLLCVLFFWEPILYDAMFLAQCFACPLGRARLLSRCYAARGMSAISSPPISRASVAPS
jgi:hypothetical protein